MNDDQLPAYRHGECVAEVQEESLCQARQFDLLPGMAMQPSKLADCNIAQRWKVFFQYLGWDQ